jgi:hypothetical protein
MAPMNPDLAAFEKRKLITLIAKNQDSDYKHELYSERRKAAYYFSQNEKDFDLYGSNWERENLVSFKGKAFSKIDTMKNYKFYLCYENNSDLDGYITEKIFDCFQAGAIPIYLGAPNIVEEIPRNCFIDRRLFSSYEELHQFLLAITEEQFENYLDNIRKFLQSPQAKKYTLNSFAFCIASGLL